MRRARFFLIVIFGYGSSLLWAINFIGGEEPSPKKLRQFCGESLSAGGGSAESPMKTKIFENEARVLLGITDDSKALAEVKVPNAFPKNLEHLNLKWVKTGHDPYAGP